MSAAPQGATPLGGHPALDEGEQVAPGPRPRRVPPTVGRRRSTAALVGRVPRPVRGALGLWALTRLGLLIATTTGSWTLTGRSAGQVQGFYRRWDHWDVGLFRKVAESGYRGYPSAYPDRGIEGFFPGYPLLLRAVHVVVPTWTGAGMLISLVAGAVGVVALAQLAQHEGVPGDRAVLYLLLSPYAVLLAAAYSESLFLALAVPGWLAARRGRWATAGVLVALATTVRVTGAFLAVALVVELLVQRRGRPGRAAGWLLLSPLALLGYWGYLYAITGDPLRWFSAQQEGWHRTFTAPQVALLHTLRYATDPRVRADYSWAFTAEVAAVLVGLVTTGVLLRRRRWAEAAYVGLGVGALATSTLYLSVNRATLLWFPLWLLLAGAAARRPWVHTAYLAGSAPLSVVLALTFTSGNWIG